MRTAAHVARQTHFVTMAAEASHSWLDTVSSFGALVGLIGVALGYRWADLIAGFAVTRFFLHVCWEVSSEIVRHLMDGVEPEHIEAAQQAACQGCRTCGCRAAGWGARWFGEGHWFVGTGYDAGGVFIRDSSG